ncbi:MAG TPA: hypothetical protein VGC97_10430 [Pyrinomonadaceae bacterium]|jgi:hypothetical protein
MKFKLVLSFIFLALCVSAGFAQTDLQITKKVSRTMPGMVQIPTEQMTPAMAKHLKEMNEVTTMVYIKGSWMRTDTTAKTPKMTGGFESHTFSTVVQCDRQRLTTFDTKSKKYSQYSMREGQTASGGKTAKKGGSITVSGSVTDAGERAKLFGFDVRRLKQTYLFTPAANACQKQKMQIEIDGWYADIPEFSCPIRMALPENTGGSDCLDDFDYQIKGAVTGIALKEIKKITIDGQIVTMDEEATEVKRTTLADSFFEPPAGYKSAAPQFNSSENPAKITETNSTRTIAPATTLSDSAPLPLPTAGIDKQPLAEKKAGVVRIGIAKPKVTTPESKKDPNAGAEIADAAAKSLVESLTAANVEAVRLETDSPENECREKGCDYIFYANITQKRGGGGMFGKMPAMSAATMAGAMIPGGGMVASTAGSAVMGQTMGKAAKAKDEFTFEYKVAGLDAGAILAQAVTKAKAEKDGEDVLTPQIKQSSMATLGEIAKSK